MASFDLQGKVLYLGPINQVTDSFKKRDLIIEVDYGQQHAHPFKIEVMNDKCEDASILEIIPGDIVTVSINVRGKAYDNAKTGGRDVFNTMAYWKMAINQTVRQPTQQQQQQYQAPQQQQQPQYQGYGNQQQGGYQQQAQQQAPPPNLANDFGAPQQTNSPNYSQSMPPQGDLPF